ncbi:DNA-binding protein [Pseudoxanthomonas sp. LjRoot143]|uniref:DNA-binding protein n=1 Tax=Pseudoxanthomonas sp. LjRoot143 TaxID=3342266 RepID=UPI003ECF089E
MTDEKKQPPANAAVTPAKRRSRARHGVLGFGPEIIDYSRFPGIRPKRLTPERVFTVCEQLGGYATTRNVQRILGGSLRDIAPLLRQWRAKEVPELGPGNQEGDVKAVGAYIVNLMRDQTAVLSILQKDASRSMQVKLQTMTDRLEELIRRVAALEAVHRQPHPPRHRK